MGQTENRPPAGLAKLAEMAANVGQVVLFLAVGIPCALLVLSHSARWLALLATLPIVAGGLLQCHRADHRRRAHRSGRMRSRVGDEARFGGLCLLVAPPVAGLDLLATPLAATTVGVAAGLLLLMKGRSVARRSAATESQLGLSKASAVDECAQIKEYVETPPEFPLIPRPKFLRDLARFEVAPGAVGLLPTVVLALVGCGFFLYASIALAVVVSGNSPERVGRDIITPPLDPSPEAIPDPRLHDDAPREESIPTYEASCPLLPDPRAIGHGLGRLFERDGAIKAGCGRAAKEVPGYGVWIAEGICSGELRSVAVSSPSREPRILYGAPAEFAWYLAQRDELLGVEAAEPGAGDVDLVEAVSGTYGFARSSRSITPGKANPRRCDDVGGVAQPFVRLPPPMVLLWRDLLESRGSWVWPVEDATSGQSLAFVTPTTGELTASGACESDISCYLDVDGETWPVEGTAFVSLAELTDYAPPHAE